MIGKKASTYINGMKWITLKIIIQNDDKILCAYVTSHLDNKNKMTKIPYTLLI